MATTIRLVFRLLLPVFLCPLTVSSYTRCEGINGRIASESAIKRYASSLGIELGNKENTSKFDWKFIQEIASTYGHKSVPLLAYIFRTHPDRTIKATCTTQLRKLNTDQSIHTLLELARQSTNSIDVEMAELALYRSARPEALAYANLRLREAVSMSDTRTFLLIMSGRHLISSDTAFTKMVIQYMGKSIPDAIRIESATSLVGLPSFQYVPELIPAMIDCLGIGSANQSKKNVIAGNLLHLTLNDFGKARTGEVKISQLIETDATKWRRWWAENNNRFDFLQAHRVAIADGSPLYWVSVIGLTHLKHIQDGFVVGRLIEIAQNEAVPWDIREQAFFALKGRCDPNAVVAVAKQILSIFKNQDLKHFFVIGAKLDYLYKVTGYWPDRVLTRERYLTACTNWPQETFAARTGQLAQGWLEWYKKNKAKLKWDPQAEKFLVGK